MMRYCYVTAILLASCTSRSPEEAKISASVDEPYSGKDSLVLIYEKTMKGEFRFLCSGAFVHLDDDRVKDPGIITASHCLTDMAPDVQGFYASFGAEKQYVKLGSAWVGSQFSGADIAFIEIDPQKRKKMKPLQPLAISLNPIASSAGDAVWSWSNPDNKGQALAVGYVMNPDYQEPPVVGSMDGQEVAVDLQGYIVVDINTSPGSSGGLVLSKKGAVGVFSADYRHESGFKIAFVTPVATLKTVFSGSAKPTVLK